mgnify:CR=1 FL=1
MPKFILSEEKVLEQYNKILDLADKISYSSKTNPLITPILEENTECMFSIHMKNELKNVKDKGRVIFLAQSWRKDDIRDLIKLGVVNFVVDNEPDLDLLLGTLNEINIKINLYLRIKLQEMSIRTERYYVFGMDRDVVNMRLKEISRNNINKIGIHFHRKTQNISEWDLVRDMETMFDDLSLVDEVIIGGGIPSSYANTNDDVLRVIFEKIKEAKEWLNERNIGMIVEPGRFIAAPSIKLECNIINIYGNTIVVDASIYNSDLDALIVPVKLKIEGELKKGEGKEYIIKGVTPCSLDLFRYRVYLPERKIGDKIVFLNSGAYNFSTDFCDLEKIETEYDYSSSEIN